jgi:hypothetical protein
MKYLKYLLILGIYLFTYAFIFFGYYFSDNEDLLGDLASISNKVSLRLRQVIDVEKLYYLNPKIINPLKPDFAIDFSKNDSKYNDSIIKSVLSCEKLLLDKDKSWRKANIFVKNRKIGIKYKFHGSSLYPYSRDHKSYSIKSEEQILGARKFKLITGIEMSYLNVFLNLISRKYELLSEDIGRIAVVNLDGEKKDFFMYKNFDEKYIKNQYKLSNPTIIRNNTFVDNSRSWHESEFDENPFNIDLDVISNKKFNQWKNLLNHKFDSLQLDKDYLGRFFALLYLFGSPHQILGNNDKWVISDKKIMPVFRNEGSIRNLGLESQNFNNTLFENNNYESLTYIKYKKLLLDKEVLNKRNYYLNVLLQDKEKILKTYDSVYYANKSKHKRHNIDYLKININHQKLKNNLHSNFSLIEKYLSYGHVIVAKEKNTLNIFSSRNNDFYFKYNSTILQLPSKKITMNKDTKIISEIIQNKIKLESGQTIGRLGYVVIDKITNDTINSLNEKSDYIEIN